MHLKGIGKKWGLPNSRWKWWLLYRFSRPNARPIAYYYSVTFTRLVFLVFWLLRSDQTPPWRPGGLQLVISTRLPGLTISRFLFHQGIKKKKKKEGKAMIIWRCGVVLDVMCCWYTGRVKRFFKRRRKRRDSFAHHHHLSMACLNDLCLFSRLWTFKVPLFYAPKYKARNANFIQNCQLVMMKTRSHRPKWTTTTRNKRFRHRLLLLLLRLAMIASCSPLPKRLKTCVCN